MTTKTKFSYAKATISGLSVDLNCPACGVTVAAGTHHSCETRNGKPVVHGVTCEKVKHTGILGYLHDADEDCRYDVDGVDYCGRCHAALPPPDKQKRRRKK